MPELQSPLYSFLGNDFNTERTESAECLEGEALDAVFEKFLVKVDYKTQRSFGMFHVGQ